MPRTYSSILWLFILGSVGLAQGSATLGFLVTDKSNNTINDLKKEEISVFINGLSQSITSLEKLDLPLSYVWAIDCSRSVKRSFGEIIDSSKLIVNSNRPKDETMLICFSRSDKIIGTQRFTADKDSLIEAIKNFTVSEGETALIDALYLAVKQLADHERPGSNRAVIVMTDGEDRNSYYNEKQLLELVQKEKIKVFIIGLLKDLRGISGEYFGKSPKDKAEDFILNLAKKSGGVAIFPKNLKNYPEAVAQLIPLLHFQYIINYTPLVDQKSKSQTIKIELAKDSKRRDVQFHFQAAIN